MIRCLRVHLWLPLRYGEVILRDLINSEVVDLTVVMAVAERLRNSSVESTTLTEDLDCRIANAPATYRICRAASVSDLYLAAETAPCGHLQIRAYASQRRLIGLDQRRSMYLVITEDSKTCHADSHGHSMSPLLQLGLVHSQQCEIKALRWFGNEER